MSDERMRQNFKDLETRVNELEKHNEQLQDVIDGKLQHLKWEIEDLIDQKIKDNK